ncbi:MAG: hypothetical protein BWY19_00852 [bacterium ADurb.Bin212]|nr:MAG: hypothetical protein BWY19_00852 [bacterium ADurb.Bin212]
MKKFHDVKPRVIKRKNSLDDKPIAHDGSIKEEHGFWHGTPKRKKKVVKDYSRIIKFFVYSLVFISFVLILVGRAYTVSAELEVNAYKAKEHLQDSLQYLHENNYNKAISEAQSAKAYLIDTKINIQSWGQDSSYLKMISTKSKYVEIEKMIDATNVLLNSSETLDDIINTYSETFSSANVVSKEQINLSLNLDKLEKSLTSVKKELNILHGALGVMGSEGIIFSADEANGLQKTIKNVETSLTSVESNILPVVKWFSGYESEKRIMIIFQNNSEIRGSGGFIGSYAIAHFVNNVLKNIDFQTNIYKLDKEAQGKIDITAPEEYALLAGGKLYLRDSNYAIDGPESFEAVRKIYQMESGQAVDGVIAIDTTPIIKLLEIVGPIFLDEYKMEVRSDNFLKDIQYEVERDYFLRDGGKEQNEPKKILADMMPIFINKTFSALKDGEKKQAIVDTISRSVLEKHILLNSSDAQTQEKINVLNYGANVRPNGDYDYLYSHSTNIGGGKSSLNINEKVTDNIFIEDFGKVKHSLNIIRDHNGTGEWPDHDNINLLRYLLPADAEIIDFDAVSGDFYPHMNKKYNKKNLYKEEIEAQKKKISFWINTSPGNSSSVVIGHYSSKGLVESGGKIYYYLLIQKQPGTPNYEYNLDITTSDKFKIKNLGTKESLSIKLSLNSDKLVKVELEER